MANKKEPIIKEDLNRPISYFSRSSMRSSSLSFKHMSLKQLRTKSVQDKVLKRMCNKSEFVEVDRKKELSVYKVSDFSMENLQAIGASLTPTVLSASSSSVVSSIANQLSNLE